MRFRTAALTVALALATGACGRGGSSAEIASSAPSTTEPSTTEPLTSAVPATAVPAPTTSSSTTITSTTSTVAVTTTRLVAPSPLATSVTTSVTGAVRCSSAQLTVEVTTGQATYRPGERVQAQAILRNRSGAPCLYTSYTGSQRFEGPTGQVVAPTVAFIADGFADTALPAGATLTQAPTWDQRACTGTESCAQALPGTYTVRVSWAFSGAPVEGAATFGLVGA